MASKAQDVTLLEYGRSAIRLYGEYVLEDRAIPDFRDGLKPVARRILWSMYKMGLHGHKKQVRKSARVVGDVLGKYHPHGDSAVYQTMVGMASTLPEPAVYGEGNWGSAEDPKSFAAQRYTECRLSDYSDATFFNTRYVPVIDLVDNFDGTEKEPLILPSLLPNLLVNGAFGIAVGGTTCIPSFAIPGLITLVSKALRGEEITVSDCVKHLRFRYRNGGEAYLAEKEYKNELRRFYRTGVGKVTFVSPYEWNEKERTLTFTEYAPSLNISKAVAAVSEDEYVEQVTDETSLEKGELPCYVIKLKKSIPKGELEETAEYVAEYFGSTINFKVNVTIRKYDKKNDEVRADFRSTTVPKLISQWVKWRVKLEASMLKHWISIAQAEIARQDLFILAANNKDIIRKSWDVNEPIKFLATKLKILESDARTIYDLRIRNLHKLDAAKHVARKKELKKEIASLQSYAKKPEQSILDGLDGLK